MDIHDLQPLRTFFETGNPRPYAIRSRQLQQLYQVIVSREDAIQKALYTDLKKSPEEAYGSEIGLVLSEISYISKNLAKWMSPKKVRTNLVNWPAASRIYHDPLGVVLIIAPWNYPFQLSLLPLAGAIAAGNTVVLKPSELAPATSEVIAELCAAVFPPDQVRLINGDGAVVVPALFSAFRFDHVFFTGSVAVGHAIYRMAAESGTTVTLELGGKSPVIVEKDADLRIAARRIVMGKFTNAGQTCVAPDYLLVHEQVRESLLQQMKETIRQFYTDDPQKSHDYGRIINTKRFDALVSYLSGATVYYGGTHDHSDLYIEPTLLDKIPPDHPLMKEEIFGPLLPIVSYRTTEEAMAIVRRHPTPLAFYLFTSDKQIEQTWLQQIPFGGGCINNTTWQFTNGHLPFGGIGNSGIGSYHGKYSFETFSHAKSVMKTPLAIDPGIKYPPFKGKMKWLKFFLR